MKTFKTYLTDDLASVQKANRKKLAAVAKANKEKEKSTRMADQEKKKAKRDADVDKQQADREKEAQARAADALKKSSKKEMKSMKENTAYYDRKDPKTQKTQAQHDRDKKDRDREIEMTKKALEREKVAAALARERKKKEQEIKKANKAVGYKKHSESKSLIQKVVEYIKSDGARRKCAGGDGRRTENHDWDKVHSGMSHDEWEASQDTPKDEATGDKEAYKKFFDAKLKKYGVSSPAELKGDDKKKLYDEIDAEWEGDNEEDR